MIDQIIAANETYKYKYHLKDEIGNDFVIYTNIAPRTFKEHTIRFRDSKFCKTETQPKVTGKKIDLLSMKPTGKARPDKLFDAEQFLSFYETKGFDFKAIRQQDYIDHIGKSKTFVRKSFTRF